MESKMGEAAFALLTGLAALVPPPAHRDDLGDHVGDTHVITRTVDSVTSDNSSEESSASTHDQDSLSERIVGIQPDGIVLDYDLPADTPQDVRARQWQLPVRVFRPADGPMRLLNEADLSARLSNWLKAGDLTRAACGRWVFTWNAFRIECNPQSVLTSLLSFDLRREVRAGAVIRDRRAAGPAILTRDPDPSAQRLSVSFALDPKAVQQEHAEADLALAQISGKSLTLDQALLAHAADRISGSIVVAFDLDSTGRCKRRRTVTTIITKRAPTTTEVRIGNSGPITEKRTITETVESVASRTAPPAPPPAGSGPGASTRPG